jgi:hypothetical protein
MVAMLGSFLLGRELDWHTIGDISGTWAYSLDNKSIAEFWWSPETREVRAEAGIVVWRVPFRGVFLLSCAIFGTEAEIPYLFFAGGLRRGLAEAPGGPRFFLFSGLGRECGPWAEIDDEEGNAVLQVHGRIGGGSIRSVVRVTSNRGYSVFVGPLLVLWGGLSILRRKLPWLSVTTLAASDAAAQREIERLQGSRSP